MRRAFPLMLSLLLFCAQSAGLLHGIGHAAEHRGTALAARADSAAPLAPSAGALREPVHQPNSADHRCDKCFAFAHLSDSAAPESLVPPASPTSDARAGGQQAALVARDAPAWRSRGPPRAA